MNAYMQQQKLDANAVAIQAALRADDLDALNAALDEQRRLLDAMPEVRGAGNALREGIAALVVATLLSVGGLLALDAGATRQLEAYVQRCEQPASDCDNRQLTVVKRLLTGDR